MNWLIGLMPVVVMGIAIIIIMRMLASMTAEEDKKRKEVNPLSSIGLLIGVAVGIVILTIMGGIIIQGGVGVNYPSFGEVSISGKGSIFNSFSYVIIAIGVFSAIYLFRRDIFRKRSVKNG